MYNLSAAGRAALAELTEYHAQRLADFERGRRARDTGPKLSIARLFSDLASGRTHGEDREFFEEHARRTGASFDPMRPVIPFSALRALAADGVGELVGQAVSDARDILRPWSVAARAGLEIEFGLSAGAAIPVVSAKTTPAWATSETTGADPSQPVIAQRPLAPHTVGVVTAFSRQLSLQSNAEQLVRRELLRSLGEAIDQAVINGSGADGEPLGLLGTSGIGSQSGTSLAHSGVVAMKASVSAANAPDEAISYIAPPAVRALLETREKGAGNGHIWSTDRVADRPAHVSTTVPAATMICGAFSQIYLGFWGSGLEVEIDPRDPVLFKVGVIRARLIASLDVAVLHPSAFSVASSIT
jgi:HK97 family phage major capsid protein